MTAGRSGGKPTRSRKVSRHMDRISMEPEGVSASASLRIERGPFEMLPHWLLMENEISSHAIRLYLVIRSFGDEGRTAWPGRSRLADLIGQSRSTVTRAVQELEEVGALCIRRRSEHSNEYHIHWHPELGCMFFGQNDDLRGRIVTGPPVDGGSPSVDWGRPPVDGGRPQVDGELRLRELRLRNLDNRTPVRKPVDDDPEFQRFWENYPRKAAKGSARRAWSKATRIASPEEIIEGAARYAADPNRDPSYTAHPATWLNGERWLDPDLPVKETRSGRKESEVMDVIARAAARDRGEIES